jgi:ABC-type amino acid transport substrate-binding protein
MNRLLAALVVAVAIAVTGVTSHSLAQTPTTRARATDTIGKLKATKQINVAVSADSFPMSFIKDQSDPVGYSIDLCKRVIAQLGRASGVPDLKITWVAGTVAERIAMVASGKADIDCANTTATLSRMNDVDFSSLIFIETGGLLVKDGGPVHQFNDLSGRTVAVISGTTTETRLDALLKQKLVNAKVVRVKDGNEAVALLEKQAEARWIRGAVEESERTGDSRRGSIARAARVCGAARRLRVPLGGQSCVDTDLRRRRDRRDLHDVARADRTSVGNTLSNVLVERDSAIAPYIDFGAKAFCSQPQLILADLSAGPANRLRQGRSRIASVRWPTACSPRDV